MDRLTLPFTIGEAIEVLMPGTGGYRVDKDHVIKHFVALDNLQAHTSSSMAFRRDARPLREGAVFGLLIQPPNCDEFTERHHNIILHVDPHRAFFTIMRAALGDNYISPDPPVFGVPSLLAQSCFVYNGCYVGKNVKVGHNTVIGGPGFGYVTEPDGSRWRVPHIGRVVIEDNVQIGSNTCIDRGCLGDTIIREGARIDNLVHIAHNVEIGRNAVVVAHAMIAGSAKIGAGAWIAPGAHVRNGVTVGANAVVGMMANVVKDVAPGVTVMGNPARER